MHFQANAAASSSVNAAGRNALMTSLTICSGFFICWTPLQIYNLVSVFSGNVDFTSWFYHFTLVLVVANSCINPFIYAAKYREFQTGVSSRRASDACCANRFTLQEVRLEHLIVEGK